MKILLFFDDFANPVASLLASNRQQEKVCDHHRLALILLQLCSGLAALHRSGSFHGLIHPDVVSFDPETARTTLYSTTDTFLTKNELTLQLMKRFAESRVEYMAAEVFDNFQKGKPKEPNPQAVDVFCLGLLVLALGTSDDPQLFYTPSGFAWPRLSQSLFKFQQLHGTSDPTLVSVVQNLLDPHPDRRLRAAQALSMLDRSLIPLPVTATLAEICSASLIHSSPREI